MDRKLVLKAGNWAVAFDEETQRLKLANASGKASVEGDLAFQSGDGTWRIGVSRDAVGERLALMTLNPRTPQFEDWLVQGYLTFFAREDALELTLSHRTAQSFHGMLHFQGEAVLPNAFACRVRAPRKHHVVVMGDGLTDSADNDALYDRETDRCLAFDGDAAFSLRTLASGSFAFKASLTIHEAIFNTLKITFERDYYKRRYVPYFKPIDRKRCPSPPTGWMSWNRYFDQAGSKENLDEARLGKKYLQPFGMEFWSIESWQDNSETLPVSKFDNLSMKALPSQFPEGMKFVADEIRKLGFRPGIWVAPFGTGSQEFYQAHKSWFLHDETGAPLKTWNGIYTIDPTNDEVIAWFKTIFRAMNKEWGYEYFKIDGMSGRESSYCAHFFELDRVRARFQHPECPNPFERCANAFREGIGPDSVFLACQGHFTGPEAAVADASRIGGDIVNPNCDSTWKNIMSQAHATLSQIFVNNIVFFTDPDTILVGDYHTLEEARVTTTVVALPGQMMFAGDKLAELTPERMRLLQQSLPVADVHPMELYPIFEETPVWDLKVRRSFGSWDVVALFNWGEEPAEVGFDFAELGLDAEKDYAVYEFWTDDFQDVLSGGFSMEVPPHAVRLLSVKEDRPYPQILSSDRHISQGAVDLEDTVWNQATKTLTVNVKLVGGYPTCLTLLVPDGMAFQEASAADAATKVSVSAGRFGILKCTLQQPESGVATVVLRFK